MYCKKCGKEVSDNARFCSYCGTPFAEEGQIKESDKPIFVTKPVFVPLLTILGILPIQIFLTIWGGMFFGMGGVFLIKLFRLNLPLWLPAAVAVFIFFLALPIFIYITHKKNYEKTEYRFYNTKLEYYEGFLNVEEKTIGYKSIMEVYLRKDFLQRMYGLGTIVLSTPATGYDAKVGQSGSGIVIVNIKNPDEAYKKIKEIIDQFHKLNK